MTDSYSIYSAGWSLNPSGWVTALLFAATVLGLPIWYIAAATLAVRESSMDKPNRVPHLYGYTVCLITLLIALFSTASLIDKTFERANPLQGDGRPFGVPLTSFEAYKTQRTAFPSFTRDGDTKPDTASEETLKTRYESLVADRLTSVRYETSKAFVTQGIMLVLAVLLFRFHWRWVRRLNGHDSTAG
jgi:hypothetical protein